MYSYKRRGTHKGYVLLAILQSILLLSALVLTTSVSIAQDKDPSVSQAPQAEQGDKIAPAADPEPGLKLRLFPRKIRLVAGGDAKVTSAWICPADIGASFGPDKKPGTGDDDCVAARAKWSVDTEDGASLSRVLGHKTRVSLLTNADVEVTAKAEGLTGTGIVSPKDAPAPKPKAKQPKADPIAEPKAEPTVSDEPPAKLTAEAKAEPTAEPTAKPKAEPTAEAKAEPTAEPKAEPTAEPKAELRAEPTVSAEPTAEPKAELRAEPTVSAEPTAEPPLGRPDCRAPGRPDCRTQGRAEGRADCQR